MKRIVIALALVFVSSAAGNGWKSGDCLYVRSGTAVYVSCDGGRSWHVFGKQVATRTEEVSVIPIGIVAYPNPAASQIRVQCRIAHSSRVWVVVRDVLGRQVSGSEPEMMSPGVHELSVRIGHLAAGTYQCEVWSTDGRLGSSLIMVSTTLEVQP